jgi:hypothetical protein
MINEEYTVNIGNLKISSPAEDIHKLVHIYGFAACEYSRQIADEIHGKHRDALIAKVKQEEKELESIEKQLIDVIRDSDYYIDYSSKAIDV